MKPSKHATKKPKRGGKRVGAGRPTGSATKKTRAIADLAIAEGITPLEVMLNVMRAALARRDVATALDAAKSAAPYIHPKLSSVEVAGKDGERLIPKRLEIVFVSATPSA